MTDPSLSPHDQEWIGIRRYLRGSRLELARKAVGLYPDGVTVGSTVLLTRPQWMPSRPIELDHVRLVWSGEEFDSKALADIARRVSPRDGYAGTMLAIDRPRLLENRPLYRLTGGTVEPEGSILHFGLGQYFDVLDIGEAAAHEFAALDMAGAALDMSAMPLRAAVGDPTDPARRPMPTAISTLTIRHDLRNGEARFLVHWRDPAKVATNGDFYQVTPVGMFQPAGDAVADFDLWRCMAREYSEELLGAQEHDDVDYDGWPFFQALQQARLARTCRAFLLGIGVDPLTLAADILTVTVFEADLFDQLFADLVAENAEGHTDPSGLPFTSETVERMVRVERMQPAGAALLDLAWRHRAVLLSS